MEKPEQNLRGPNDRPSLDELDGEKTAAKRSLFSKDPQIAQEMVNQTLHPLLWTTREGEVWEERLPRVKKTFERESRIDQAES
jgi:hypothetical protein